MSACDTCGTADTKLILDTQGASHCPSCWKATRGKPGYVCAQCKVSSEDIGAGCAACSMPYTKLRDVYHVEIKRTDPRQCADEAFTVENPQVALGILRNILGGREQESFIALMLDSRYRIIAWREVGRGTSDAVELLPRDLFRTVLMVGSSKIIISHNHPSGDPSPSPQDMKLTRRLVEVGALIGIEILDHVIIGAGDNYFSFATNGMPSSKSEPLMTGPRQGPELD